MTIADRMAIFFDGEIIQIGTPDQVFNRPDTMDVAAFIGSPPMNLLDADHDNGRLSIAGQTLDLTAPQGYAGSGIVIGIRPSHVRPADKGIPARLLLSENLGESMLLNVDLNGQIVKMRIPEIRRFTENEPMQLSLDSEAVHFFDPKSRKRLPRSNQSISGEMSR